MRFTFALCAALLGVPALAQDNLIATLERGSWGWPEGENTCALNPQTFRFSQDRREMVVTWRKDHAPVTYRVFNMMPRTFYSQI